ncbi:hypothetical protein OHA40_28685 [Nocardia sp. NBC_00508]|uniref:hypothetical protein n=1 Tax=Nocardia sp. NBC_00508 TaxID=2975992 RepID=UPI002E81F645|nr:hypothetical protein [Nocardia sp. NBC_00508]WUD65556.1 hypothetical protein OHA40_28685 [Nocardia sp. NBC_00508]
MGSARRFQRSGVAVAATAIALVGLLSGCGSEKGAEPAAQAASPATASAAVEPVAGQAPAVAKTQGWLKIYSGQASAGTANAVQLDVTSNPTVGKYVSDGAGRSLYRFDKDTAQPSASNCSGQCAVTWPPLTVARGQVLYASGVDPQLVGFIERADGACQITIGGWPVYYFSKDSKPGDLLGQGVGGTWFAVAPNGGKALSK